jgi:hypothetical protein
VPHFSLSTIENPDKTKIQIEDEKVISCNKHMHFLKKNRVSNSVIKERRGKKNIEDSLTVPKSKFEEELKA